jgi:hypothetical protein
MTKRGIAHVERLSKPSKIMVKKRTASGSRVHEIYVIVEDSLWCRLLVYNRFWRSLEAQ